jgi:hypothetical protein
MWLNLICNWSLAQPSRHIGLKSNQILLNRSAAAPTQAEPLRLLLYLRPLLYWSFFCCIIG